MKLIIIFLITVSLIIPANFSYAYRFRSSLYSDYLKGIYSLQSGNLQTALKYLRQVKARLPDSVYIRLKIAAALIQAKDTDGAEKVLKEAKRLDPDSLDIYLALIFIYSYEGQQQKLGEEYESFLEKAHQKKPESMTITSYLAQFYLYKKRPEEAITLYEKILKEKPDNLEAFFWLGYLYDKVGRRQESRQLWEKGLAINPLYAPILNALAYSYTEEGIRLDKAERMIKKALKEEPRNGAYLDSLGWVYFKKGNLRRAKEYSKQAIAYSQDPEIYQHLGTIYIKLGQKEKGLEVYKEGLRKFPNYQELEKKVNEYEKEDKKNKE